MRTSRHSPGEIEGTHVVVEYSDCDSGVLDDEAAIESLLVGAAESTGAAIVDCVMHRFRPRGVTGCIILSDAHLTIHTWPEVGYASVDFYTSGHTDPRCIHAVLAEALRSEESEILVVDRGLAGPEKIRVRGFGV